MEVTEIVALIGASISAAAYFPQIIHLIKEQCSAGISQRAYLLWLIASLTMLSHAIAIRSGVFIFLTGTQSVSTALILFYAYRYPGTCAFHKGYKKEPTN